VPTAAEVKALALDPVGRFDALPDLLVTKWITRVSRLYASDVAEEETDDLIGLHVAHLLAKAGVGGVKGGGAVASQSVSLGGASTSYAVQAPQPGVAVDPLDTSTPYGSLALGLRVSIPTIDTGGA
jgi:hypothetical protein